MKNKGNDLQLPDTLRNAGPSLPPSLSEDNLSDLLWLVDNYGHKLTEVADYITVKDIEDLSNTLEKMLNNIA
jgi:hypothetical protein